MGIEFDIEEKFDIAKGIRYRNRIRYWKETIWGTIWFSILKRNYFISKTNLISRTNPPQICEKRMALMSFCRKVINKRVFQLCNYDIWFILNLLWKNLVWWSHVRVVGSGCVATFLNEVVGLQLTLKHNNSEASPEVFYKKKCSLAQVFSCEIFQNY